MAKQDKLRTSFWLSTPLRKAMRCVADDKKIFQSHQVEFAMKDYLKKEHSDILKKYKIKL